jgi:hypothetical protein
MARIWAAPSRKNVTAPPKEEEKDDTDDVYVSATDDLPATRHLPGSHLLHLQYHDVADPGRLPIRASCAHRH